MLTDVAPLRQRKGQDIPKSTLDVVQHHLMTERLWHGFDEERSGDVVELMVDVLEIELIRELTHDVTDPVSEGLVGEHSLRSICRSVDGSCEGDEAGSDT